MARVELSVSINRPVKDVFAILTDPAATPKWSASALEGELITPGEVGVGSRRRTVAKGIGRGTVETVMEVTVFEPLRRVALKSVKAAFPISTSYTFTPIRNGTRVDWTWWFEPRVSCAPSARCSPRYSGASSPRS